MKKMKDLYINSGSLISLSNLGYYYQYIEKNYEKMKEYYLKAEKSDNVTLLFNFGYYYQYTEINYNKMLKYYLRAIEKGNNDPIIYLGYYYLKIKDYEEMKKYFEKSVENKTLSHV